MAEVFKPIGERSRWRMIYDLMRAAKIGDTVTYDVMAEHLGLDAEEDRHALQMAARRAGLELEKVDRRAADAVRNVGYRIVEPTEILGLGRRRNRKAGSQIARGAITVRAVDRNHPSVTTEMCNALEALARGFAMQQDINRAVFAKQKRQDDLIDMVLGRVERVERRMGITEDDDITDSDGE